METTSNRREYLQIIKNNRCVQLSGSDKQHCSLLWNLWSKSPPRWFWRINDSELHVRKTFVDPRRFSYSTESTCSMLNLRKKKHRRMAVNLKSPTLSIKSRIIKVKFKKNLDHKRTQDFILCCTYIRLLFKRSRVTKRKSVNKMFHLCFRYIYIYYFVQQSYFQKTSPKFIPTTFGHASDIDKIEFV